MGEVLTTIGGLLLAGGRGQRLGGRDKAFLPLAGAPLLTHGIACLRPQCAPLIISANGDPSRFAPFGLPVVADTSPAFAGPLAGILAGLDHLWATLPAVRQVLSLPADTPFAPPDLVARLREARLSGGADIAVASSAGRVHHAVALWRIEMREALRAALEGGERSIGRFAARFATTVVEWPGEPFDPFFNINTPDDLLTADALARTVRADRVESGN